ncbi:MAG TPA: NADPH-dependent FMN reductase [Candidatus Bathyarchaeia archaeon]|nr:NADPH-dependent FMN reductase [Candidatus Bathyarchaeia archaeon]
MKIMVLNGSATKQSHTRGLSKAFIEALSSEQVELLTFDVGIDMLPIFTGSPEDREHPAVRKLQSYAEQADGFVITTPEYHNSMSGALKNALDYLGGRQFKGKPVVIGAAAGGGKGGINALNSLRQVLRGVYALVLPDQIVSDPDQHDEKADLVQWDALERVNGIAAELQRVTKLLSAGR